MEYIKNGCATVMFGLVVSSAIATPNDWANNQKFDCIISPSKVIDLGSSLPGVLRAISIDKSDAIKAGDIVAQLDSGVEEIALKLARARANMDGEINLQQISAAYDDRRARHFQKLHGRSALSAWDLDQSKTEARLAEVRLQQAKDTKDLAVIEHEYANKVLSRRTIYSPISGVVVERYIDVGEYVDEQPIARIVQLSPLFVDVLVPVSLITELHQGMLADVRSDLVKGQWTAKVDRVDKVAEPASGTIGVRLLLDNDDYAIPAGIRCSMVFRPTNQLASNGLAINNDE